MLRGGGQKNREDGHTGRCERQEAKANEGVGEAVHERNLHQYVWNSLTVQQPMPLPKLDRFETSRKLAPERPEKARLSLDGGGVQHEKLPHVASLAALCQAPSPLHHGLMQSRTLNAGPHAQCRAVRPMQGRTLNPGPYA